MASFQRRCAEDQYDRLPQLAADLVHRQVAAIALIVPTSTVNQILYSSLGSDFGRDIVLVASMGLSAFRHGGPPGSSGGKRSEFIAHAEANPGKIDVATPGIRTLPHIFGEVFRMRPAYVCAGKLRAIGVTTAKRTEALQDVPTIGESVPGYEASEWYAIDAPTGTPAEIIAMLNDEIDAVVADPPMKTRLAGLGIERLSPTPADLAAFIAAEAASGRKS